MRRDVTVTMEGVEVAKFVAQRYAGRPLTIGDNRRKLAEGVWILTVNAPIIIRTGESTDGAQLDPSAAIAVRVIDHQADTDDPSSIARRALDLVAAATRDLPRTCDRIEVRVA